jgi:hypothetical protein
MNKAYWFKLISSILSSFEGMKNFKLPLEKYQKDIIIK